MLKRIVSGLSAAAMLSAMVAATPVTASADTKGGEMRDISAAQIVKEMGIGINLGNTFEACGDWIEKGSVTNYETAWGSPEITEEMIKGYAEAGFESLRIPVAWSNLMADDGEYNISPELLARVKEVTDWALDAGLYVIINEHWDGGWMNTMPETEETWEEGMKKYRSIWTAVAEEFKDYGDHLIFESQNEELGAWQYDDETGTHFYYWNRWGGDTEGKQTAYDLCNEVNQEFVNIIRNSGGNNGQRHLLISGFCTDIDTTCDPMFKMPEDTVPDRMAVSVHYYTPSNYALGTAKSWGSAANYEELNYYMDKLEDTFVSKGVPVIIGECCNGMEISKKDEGTAREYMKAVCEAAVVRGMCPMLWDIAYNEDKGEPVENQVYDRRRQKMTDTQLQADLNDIVDNNMKGELKKGSITAPESITVTYNDPSFKIEAAASGNGKIIYSSSNEKVVTVSADGEVAIVGNGTAEILMFVASGSGYTAAAASTAITVNRASAPPVIPEKEMVVDESVTSTADIELPEGWSWQRKVELELDTPTVARAMYFDANYNNRIIDITITRTKKTDSGDDTSSLPDTTSSDDASAADKDSSAADSSSSASSDSSSSASSSSSSASSASQAAANNSAAAAADTNPATGRGLATGAAAVLALALIQITYKKSKND